MKKISNWAALVNKELKKETIDYIETDFRAGRIAQMINGYKGILFIGDLKKDQRIREDLFNFLRKLDLSSFKGHGGVVVTFIEWLHLELYFIQHFEYKDKEETEKRIFLLVTGLKGAVKEFNKNIQVPEECLKRIFGFYGFNYEGI